jgi:hypothetical protein
MSKLVCPLCGESKNVELGKYLSDNGIPMIRLTCRVAVHEEPVVQEIAASALSAPKAVSTGGFVHEHDLYYKLEETVIAIGRPCEYGVVEHEFAERFPVEFTAVWQRFGHIATHGPRNYTMSGYLAGLLHTIAETGAITQSATYGTGRWRYLGAVSAWSAPTSAAQPVLTWKDYAIERGFGKDDWPAAGLLPDGGVPKAS